MKLIERIRAAGAIAWLRFVQALNWIALTFGGLILAVNSMFPRAVEEAVGSLPPAAKFAGLALWAGLVHFSIRRAKVEAAAPSSPQAPPVKDVGP